jgi:Flp pilus assembly protein TadG
MKPPAIRQIRCARHASYCSLYNHSRHPRQRERGITMVLVAIAMVAIIGMAALSIDVITLYLAREQAQRSADEAALAAARVISLSGATGDPNDTLSWQVICGTSTSPATQTATAVATQSEVGGAVATTVSVGYSVGTGAPQPDCSGLLPGPFGVNPLVTVTITRASLPTFFSRIWGNTGNSVSASATAEVLNPSASDIVTNASVIPVQPSCVKPWMVPNQNPDQPSGCVGGTGSGKCNSFVTLTDGTISNQGIQPGTASGVIGETFTLFADCTPGVSPCGLVTFNTNNQPQANVATNTIGPNPGPPNLEYLAGLAPPSSVAVPSCGASGSGGNADYLPAVAGCDQSTIYQCGVQSSVASPPNSIDLSENPGGSSGDTATGVACLINQATEGSANSGQDWLITTGTPPYPYQILAGPANANVAVRGDYITSSNSIMSLPIYDATATTITSAGPNNVTIVGFLQVFVNYVNPDGSLNVTVMNVAGCGNNATSRAVTGSSPVPIRLVTPP